MIAETDAIVTQDVSVVPGALDDIRGFGRDGSHRFTLDVIRVFVIEIPFGRVVADIAADGIQIFLVADDVFIVIALPLEFREPSVVNHPSRTCFVVTD